MPSDSVIPQTTPADDRVGFVNYHPDPVDGIVRSAVFAQALESLNGYAYRSGQELHFSLAARALAKAGLAGKIPRDRAEHLIHFTAPAALRPQPFYEIFVPRYWEKNFQNGAVFRDKIVMVGPYAEVLHDTLQTPLRKTPGPQMHLQTLNAALQNDFLAPFSHASSIALIAAAALLAFLITTCLAKPLVQFISLMGGSGIFIGLAWLSYNEFQRVPLTVAPLLALNGGGILSLVYQFIVEQLERARTRRTLERYVSRNLVSELLDNPEEFLGPRMGGANR